MLLRPPWPSQPLEKWESQARAGWDPSASPRGRDQELPRKAQARDACAQSPFWSLLLSALKGPAPLITNQLTPAGRPGARRARQPLRGSGWGGRQRAAELLLGAEAGAPSQTDAGLSPEDARPKGRAGTVRWSARAACGPAPLPWNSHALYQCLGRAVLSWQSRF